MTLQRLFRAPLIKTNHWTLLRRFSLLVTSGLIVASCAEKRVFTPVNVPEWDVVQSLRLEPPSELSGRQKRDFEEGWDLLKEGRLAGAASELEGLGRRYPQSPEIAAALGYLELKAGNPRTAERYFDTALSVDRDIGAATVGSFLAAMVGGDEEAALERLSQVTPEAIRQEMVSRYETTLRLNVAEARLSTARRLANDARYEEAAAAFVEVLDVAPEAAGLYVETAQAELSAGLVDRAIEHAKRATELDDTDADAFELLGEACEAADDLGCARSAFRAAAALRPGDLALRERVARVEAEYNKENLPEEYEAIRASDRLTREQLAALLFYELRGRFDGLQTENNVIATDISTSWAYEPIRRVLGAGILEVFPNHTFQPKAFVDRIDFARALAAAVRKLAPAVYEAAKRSPRFEQSFADLSPTNVSYEAAALAISLGLMMPGENDAFEPLELVSGADAVLAMDALSAHLTL
jgi:Flp pilus assembly protein TadD